MFRKLFRKADDPPVQFSIKTSENSIVTDKLKLALVLDVEDDTDTTKAASMAVKLTYHSSVCLLFPIQSCCYSLIMKLNC